MNDTTAPAVEQVADYPSVETKMVPERGIRLPYETYERYGPDHAYVEAGVVSAEVDGKPRPAKGAVVSTGEVWVRMDLIEELEGEGVQYLAKDVKSALMLRGWVKQDWRYDGVQVYVGTQALTDFLSHHNTAQKD